MKHSSPVISTKAKFDAQRLLMVQLFAYLEDQKIIIKSDRADILERIKNINGEAEGTPKAVIELVEKFFLEVEETRELMTSSS